MLEKSFGTDSVHQLSSQCYICRRLRCENIQIFGQSEHSGDIEFRRTVNCAHPLGVVDNIFLRYG